MEFQLNIPDLEELEQEQPEVVEKIAQQIPPEETQAQEETSPADEGEDTDGSDTPTANAEGQTSSTEQPATDAEGNPLPTGSTGNNVVDTLGIGETKISAPNVNPLDDTGDDIFDELK